MIFGVRIRVQNLSLYTILLVVLRRNISKSSSGLLGVQRVAAAGHAGVSFLDERGRAGRVKFRVSYSRHVKGKKPTHDLEGAAQPDQNPLARGLKTIMKSYHGLLFSGSSRWYSSSRWVEDSRHFVLHVWPRLKILRRALPAANCRRGLPCRDERTVCQHHILCVPYQYQPVHILHTFANTNVSYPRICSAHDGYEDPVQTNTLLVVKIL